MSPKKEPHYFSFVNNKPNYQGPYDKEINKEIVANLNEYEKLFDNFTSEKMVGECSTSYLFLSQAAYNIKKFIPKCKIVIILRNPIDRAYSNYMHHVMLGQEKLSFEDAILSEKERKKSNWRWSYQYIGQSLYSKQVKRYINLFGRDNIKIYFFYDLKSNPLILMENVFNYLEIENCILREINIQNKTGIPKSEVVHQFLRSNNRLKDLTRPLMSKRFRGIIYKLIETINYDYNGYPNMNFNVRKKLADIFYADICDLQKLLKIDLSSWMGDCKN
jgi:hypothetical protein